MLVQEHQLNLFDAERLPVKPYCSDDLEKGLRIRPLKAALMKPYIQINPPHLRFWMTFDIDRPGGGLAWEDANLPRPAWAAINRDNRHAHIAYGLSAPVLIGDNARRAPIRFLQGIEGAYRVALNADFGYSGLITKNPQHSRWMTLRGLHKLWGLQELAEYAEVDKYIPKHAKKPEEYGLGRNCLLFDHLRLWAYRRIRKAKEQGKFILWLAECTEQAAKRNGDFMTPLYENEVRHIAKSVAKWTWSRFDLTRSDAKFSATQAHRGAMGGKASGMARLSASEEKRASARLMAAKGMSARQIAAELGVSKSTISNWLTATL